MNTNKPAVWEADPECGHQVAFAFQTHYCTYIRAPRLLTLQRTDLTDELLLVTACQWYELWFKVLLTDLRAFALQDSLTYEPLKLLRRGIEIFKLLDQHTDMAEAVLLRELGLRRPVRARGRNPLAASDQFTRLAALCRRLTSAARMPYPGLAEAADEYLARFRSLRSRLRRLYKGTLIPRSSRAPTYSHWLHLSDLLDLQDGVKSAWTEPGQPPAALMKPERVGADEMMFIIVHQCFELWFKVLLDQIDRAIPAMEQGRVVEATRLLRRVVAVQRLLVQQIQIPATMLPLDFLRFRDQQAVRDGRVVKTGLSPASGTESYQFREIEIVCGLRDDPVFQRYLAGSDKLPIRLLTPRQSERLDGPTLPDAFRQAVRRRGIDRLDDLFTAADQPNPHADLAQLADTLIEFDEFFRLWRLGHITMVEKMIGARSGTGFLGPEYLMETAGVRIQEKNRVFEERQVRPRFFEELWAVRTRLGAY